RYRISTVADLSLAGKRRLPGDRFARCGTGQRRLSGTAIVSNGARWKVGGRRSGDPEACVRGPDGEDLSRGPRPRGPRHAGGVAVEARPLPRLVDRPLRDDVRPRNRADLDVLPPARAAAAERRAAS